MNHSIVLIDDNFSIRQIVKIFLARLSRKYALDLKVFTSDNGVEGLGFVFITTPSLVIIDTTLPKYSGREVLDFLIHNPKFHSDETKVIVLHEGNQKNLNLPKNFSVVNKNDKNSFKYFSELVFNILGISDPSHSNDLFNKLSRFVLKNSNQDDLLNKALEQEPLFKRFFLRFKWTWLELSTSIILTLIILLYGRADDENITQQDIDKRAFRTKYYPTLVVTFISLTIIFINLGLFITSQISLMNDVQLQSRALTTFTVDSTADTTDFSIGDGFCDANDSVGDGPCTLRAAIQEGNVTVDDVTINFNIPGAGVHTLTPSSSYPTITRSMTIDATTEPGTACTTSDLMIELDGTSAGSTNGLTVSSGAASAVSLRGLVLNHFGTSEITVTDSNQVNITCNIIGLDADGATMEIGGAGGDGIIATGNSHLVIGGSTVSDRNIISGTGDDGIIISGSSTANIQGNFIGTDKTGLLDKGNDDVGITITSSGQGTIIGGNTSLNPGIECAGSCNLISGNGPGIYIARDSLDPYLDSNLSILGNFIGTDKTGSATIGNVSGISITYADGITIGGANTNERNIISGNTQNGIYLYSAHTNRVQDLIIQYNYIGTDNAGTSALGNSLNGVLAFNHMPDLTITGNTISSNGTNGISTDLTLSNAPVDSINIFSNNIGTRSDGTGDLGNAYSGISLLGRGQVNIGAQNQGNIINNSGHRGVTVNSAPNPDPPSATISADIRYNTISGNDQGGILAYWNDHLILNNIINSNTGSGIEYLAGSDISIIANQISNNTDKGVSLPSNFVPTGAKIGRNYIYANSFNIDLADNGRTSNDVDDVDTGANNLQNYPELASSEIDGTTLSIFGTFNSIPSEYYLLEFFSTDLGVAVAGDTKSYLGFSVINTDVNGDVNFSSTPLTLNSITLDPGETYLTAIASRCVDANCTLTENAIETSEISNSVEITQIAPSDTPTPTPTETPVPSDTPIPGPTDTPVPGASDTPVPTLTNTPLPTLTNTPLPTVTNTPVPVPTDTPVPAPSSTTAPAVVSSPTLVSTLAGTRTPVPTASDTPTVTPTEGFVTSESTPTPSITPVPTIETPIVTDTPSSSTSYVPPEESVVNLPVVKSMSLALANSVQDVPVLGSLLDNAIEFSGRIKPLTDNLSYLLSLQFVGSSVASSGVTAINLLALAAPAIASTFAQPRLFYYALAWFWKRKSKLPWGIISDKFSHSPVAFARVTLVKDGQRIDSQTTDLQGKYGFMADKGEYQIFITHPDYTDFSKEISVKYDGQTLAQDFELNSKAQQDFGSSLTWVFYQARKFIKQNLFILNTIIFSTGFVYTVFAVANSLTVFNYIILSLYLLQIVLIMVFYFTASKKWGQVLDVSTGEAIPGAIVRLLNNERQLDVAITDLQGRYNFILEPGEYYLKVSAPGYMFPTDDTPNVVVNQAGEKLMKFSVEKTERLSIKLYMQRFSNVQINRNTILSPFN